MAYDIIISGAGPVGLSFALSLKDSGLNILIIEKQSQSSIAQPQADGREIALTHLSKQILTDLDCWHYLENNGVAPIKQAKVFNGDSLYFMDFISNKGQDLGFLTPNFRIREILYQKVSQLDNVTLICDQSVVDIKTNTHNAWVKLSDGQEHNAKLVIAADSKFSSSRAKMGIGTIRNDFARTAIVCPFKHELPHQQTAIECFHYGRTLAMLPMQDQTSSAVITVANNEVEEVLSLSQQELALDIETRLNSSLGKMQAIAKPISYPLTAIHAKELVKARFALLGDTAVGMHPVTAHGFNLGLRGQNNLAKLIIKAHHNKQDIGALSILRKYEIKHMMITIPLYLGTNSIVALFTNDNKAVKLLRKAIIKVSNNLPPIKSLITNSLTESKQFPKPAFLDKLPKPPKLN